jgi:hypothetical protein
MKLREEIARICAASTAIFRERECVKLELRALLCEV